MWKENSSFVFHLYRSHPSIFYFIDSVLSSCTDSIPSDYHSLVLTGIKYCQQGWEQTPLPSSQLHRGHDSCHHQSWCVSSSDWRIPFLVPAFWVFTCVLSHSVVSNSYNPIDFSPPDSSVHGIFQARILERAAIYNMSGCWTLWKILSASIEKIIWLFSSSLLRWWTTLIDS